jgi:hypothetical protein
MSKVVGLSSTAPLRPSIRVATGSIRGAVLPPLASPKSASPASPRSVSSTASASPLEERGNRVLSGGASPSQQRPANLSRENSRANRGELNSAPASPDGSQRGGSTAALSISSLPAGALREDVPLSKAPSKRLLPEASHRKISVRSDELLQQRTTASVRLEKQALMSTTADRNSSRRLLSREASGASSKDLRREREAKLLQKQSSRAGELIAKQLSLEAGGLASKAQPGLPRTRSYELLLKEEARRQAWRQQRNWWRFFGFYGRRPQVREGRGQVLAVLASPLGDTMRAAGLKVCSFWCTACALILQLQ